MEIFLKLIMYIIIIIALVIGYIIFFSGWNYSLVKGFSVIIIGGIIAVYIGLYIDKSHELIERAESLPKTEEYEVYLNGMEVDYRNVDFSRYYIKINDEEKRIILTDK